jgi:hypothetical protein
MSRPVKVVLYIVCVLATVVFGYMTVRHLRRAGSASEAQQQKLDEAAVPAEGQEAGATPKPVAVTSGARANYSAVVSYGLLAVLAFCGFAALLARDVSHGVASKAEQALFNNDGAPVDAEYEQAEELIKDAKYLEGIQAMRDYLKKNPREQYVALRIAEIYEQNLHNPLAAALEYEEVLKKKLPPERWGWAAIHLANLYSGKLSQPDKAVAMLQRIHLEYGHTTAAKKARERLVQIDPSFVAEPEPDLPEPETPVEAKPASNLPPGFRPKS